ncbi:M28 family peptidase [Ammoniphilus sp. YIM 78166]|uniref:M28 family peptidase n=1 Tax=Ammoniphilus sp. YIM 78166 TaxID=1644106 RepID=UPI00106F5E6D|nr:M28 family peptidase [Ammoniphilus sp. YIM 78166]
MLRKPFLSMTLAASLTFGATVAFAQQPVEAKSNPSVQAFDNKIVKKINVDNIYNMIGLLSETPRVSGTIEEANTAQYIKDQLEGFGLKTEVQEFQFESWRPATDTSLSVNGQVLDYKPRTMTFTPSGDVTAPLAYAGLGTVAEAASAGLSGKIALIQRGSISFAEKVVNAYNNGAVGVIIYNNQGGDLNGTLGNAESGVLPAVGITLQQGNDLLAQLQQGEVTVNLKVVGAANEVVTSQNVIATKPATQKDTGDIIIISSHHDSVPLAPGANDNASGVAVTVEMARIFEDMPTDTELRFITFGSEEVGLVGSDYYARNLSAEEKARIKGVFNLDMVGSKDAGDLVMYTSDGQKNTVTDLTASAAARLSVLPAYGGETRSDHHSFWLQGIPAALYIHSPLEPWYHTPQDTLDKISKEKLLDVAQIVGAAVYQAARPDTPALQRSKVAPREIEYEDQVPSL